jgi:hypothetical protein
MLVWGWKQDFLTCMMSTTGVVRLYMLHGNLLSS